VLYVAPRATRTSMNSPAAQGLERCPQVQRRRPANRGLGGDPRDAGERRDLYLGWPERFSCASTACCPTWWTEACASNCR
jgi:hypothetical protein